ncbi:MAG TPA: hypothetical protein VGZ26_10665 [Pirellulales bacterium]|nr:hypothetical protein [Pirellulales bacterium]
MNRIRWLILILGPVPIFGTSWTVSAWLRSDPAATPSLNRVESEPPTAETAGPRPFALLADDADPALARACSRSAERLEKELGPECRILARAPFVLGGDLGLEELAAWHEKTIAPAVRAMENCYFQARPNQPITVLLFRTEHGYDHYSQKLFGEADISPYGYYKPNLRTLLVNVATGDGSLLHELTHALVDFDFPNVPDWLNEGLASLHEQSRFRDGPSGPWIEGLVNWRLRGLQVVIGRGRLRSLASLVEERNFRGPLEGTNYAQARYFCLFLQQKGLLEQFYRAFHRNHPRDPRGLATLAETFPHWTWQKLDQDFERWAIELAE